MAKTKKNRKSKKALPGSGKRKSVDRIIASRKRQDKKHTRAAGKGKLFECTFIGSSNGFGFARPLDPECTMDDLFIPPSMTEGAFNGDTVLVRQLLPGEYGYGKGNEGTVERIITRGSGTVIGVCRIVGDIPCVIPDDRRQGQAIEIMMSQVDISEGDKVKMKITKYPDEYRDLPFVRRRKRRGMVIEPIAGGDIEQNYGNAQTKSANYEAILDNAGIPRHFPDEVLAEADAVSKEYLSPDERLDLRGSIIFTIDGAGAKDLDDAISIERKADGYVLGVHIADVSHYVRAGGKIDDEAKNRGTSVYFVDKVVPMLPEVLSNGCCSLNADEDKYALSATIELDRTGEIQSYSFAKSIIRSAVRGVYSEVNDILEKGKDSEFAEKYEAVLPSLEIMEELYRILDRRSRMRGALDLDGDEAVILVDEEGFPTEIVARSRGIAERIIEQFMLRANVAAASFLKESGRSGVYRIHEEPAADKMQAFGIFAHNMGLDVSSICKIHGDTAEACKKITPAMLSEILAQAKEKGISDVVSGVMLRSLMKAKYSPAPSLHFGLAEELYCHFTSPIRRYPDLFVHRSISAAIAGAADVRGSGEAAQLSTDTEVRAVEAERAIEDLYIALYMSNRIGVEYDATVSSVTSFGVFARTDNMCEGLIPSAALGDVLSFNDKNLTMTVRRGREVVTLHLGDRIRIKVADANIATGKVEFVLV